ncbi:GMC family oxidoreductase N-terminal domain-containing protein [Streptomyces purpurascens]|uniref:GMC family oxidoreductase N-terminal domain-containing protein n=1 Tax=Streptomyces purpurascens TaxID=1924 RepID=UPI001674492E|nr:GMC family oxidoreductase [Streptomyces purpurascens]MCE7048326.1 GMC family oxidoreductase [Streptomyces purpurascens]GHA25909.1 putative GMC-type oxidoreductase y4nJ [Streptomyces purpurascens]
MRRAFGRQRSVDTDVLVIGSGAGGSVAALELAAAGRQVTVLEEGPRADTAALAAASPAENMRNLYRNGGLTPVLGTPTIVYGEGRAVGGTTLVNGGLLWEPPPALLARWAAVSGIDGYRAADLAPHLKTVSARLGPIVQQHGDGGANRDSRLLAVGADRLGWRWQHARRVVQGCLHRNRCTTGCPSGAKQSMAVSYLPRAEALGAHIRPDTRVLRLLHDGRTVHGALATGPDGARTEYRARSVFLAAGPLGTPGLLQRSRIQQRRAGRDLALHVNLRTVARFPERVAAHDGTIFTAQLKEFGDRGILVMPSNVSRGALAAALAGRDPAEVTQYLDDYDRLGVYTTQVRLHGTATVRALPGGGLLLRHNMTAVDHGALVEAFRIGSRLLLAAGADQLTPPVSSAPPLSTMAEVEEFCRRVRPGDWELVSVHGMASARMAQAERGGVCDERGRPYGFEGLRVCDASVLPGVTGISPQGTIMAFAHEITARFIEDGEPTA